MDWKSIYQSKRMTVNEAIALIHNGDKVVTGFACGEPLGIERALVEQYRNFQDVEIISMLTLGDCPWTAPKMAGHFHLNCLFASAGNRGAIANGTCDFTTCHFYEIPDLLENYVCPDVAVGMGSPPDEHGYVILPHHPGLHQGCVRRGQNRHCPGQQLYAPPLWQQHSPCTGI